MLPDVPDPDRITAPKEAIWKVAWQPMMLVRTMSEAWLTHFCCVEYRNISNRRKWLCNSPALEFWHQKHENYDFTKGRLMLSKGVLFTVVSHECSLLFWSLEIF